MKRPSLRIEFAVVGATLLALAIGGILVVTSGVYNVAASKPHFGIVRALLQFALDRSVATHSWFVPPPPADLNDVDRVRLGAGHFVRGCAACHGAPGKPREVFAHYMLPAPPTLSANIDEWTDKELFWIVKNGFKFTGMPAWPASERNDEIWSVVAFLRQLPAMSAEEYRQLTAPIELATSPPRTSGGKTLDPLLLADCSRCHGDDASPPPSRLVPKLAGQKEAYLRHALQDYAHRRRPSGVMEALAVPLDAQLQSDLAAFYASLPASSSSSPDSNRAQIERGRLVATQGLPKDGVPACVACHSSDTAITFPRLAGQYAPYIAQQLRLYKRGLRDGTPQGAIMTAIAKRLDEAQFEDVAAYFEDAKDQAQSATGAPR
jgi:cytochrome c553